MRTDFDEWDGMGWDVKKGVLSRDSLSVDSNTHSSSDLILSMQSLSLLPTMKIIPSQPPPHDSAIPSQNSSQTSVPVLRHRIGPQGYLIPATRTALCQMAYL